MADRLLCDLTGQPEFHRAVNCTLKSWNEFIVNLEKDQIPVDNNSVENAIQPFVVGRKVWLFSGSPAGVHASAAL